MSAPPLQELHGEVCAAATAVRGSRGELTVELRLERPKREGLGDYSTNAAMLLAPVLDAPPRVIAERLGEELAQRLGPRLERAEVAGPGFLNLKLSDGWFFRALDTVLAAGERFGGGGADPAERVLVEFVSANPTGPLVAASGRHAAYGDALARVLEHHGHAVSREYYFNDAGNQIRLLGESVRARARGEPVPEGGYQGDYVAELAKEIPDAAEQGADPDRLAAEAVSILLRQIRATLERYGVRYDTFFSERALHERNPSEVERALTEGNRSEVERARAEGNRSEVERALTEGNRSEVERARAEGNRSEVERALAELESAGHIYRSDGAVWLRTTSFGDDKDRVVVRTNGEPTYLAADIAYVQNKRERGFERQLLPVGADHHAYARELKAVMAALGGDPDRLEVPILQFVHLVEGSERTAFSKRRGAFVTLDDLLDEIGVDATRFFMLQRSHDRTLDLDLDLARSQSAENPVYYVQYAHARIASMLSRLSERRVEAAVAGGLGAWGGGSPEAGPLHASERGLIKKLVALPEEVAEAAERRAPHRIAVYALELAQEFTAFYRDCHVLGAKPEALESFRIALSVAAQRTIALSLGLLGVSAPDSM